MAKIVVKSERCKSCGYCIKFCPKGYEYVVPTNMDACIACCMCGRICPDGAIEIYK